jgi:anaerobic magnesium-protoporphyrin IX monomethyl ester cyclase
MKLRMVCFEDGIMSCGFRKIAAWAEGQNHDTRSCFVSTNHFGGLRYLRGQIGGAPTFDAEAVDEVARGLADADVIGVSSMTGYADMTKAVVSRVRELSPQTYIIWGGIHPIIHPEDAITADVDAICTGEGEFALEELLARLRDGRSFTGVKNFWFKHRGDITRNDFLPLMSSADMERLPFPKYGETEWIYKKGAGFVPVTVSDYLATNGLGYNAIWSIGCPFHCTYCGNTKFIANDSKYKKLRYPTARYCIDEIKEAVRKQPHLSSVSFHDDSFLAIPYRDLERFSELWHDEVKLPFAVYGVIPNYVKQDKFEILTWAGMNRIRMGIQSGSEQILEFYKRPTPPKKIKAAATVCASFAPKYHIPPAYDIITDNPVETREDVVATLEMLYELARPFTLNLFSLKVIPNTTMERLLAERGIDLDAISASYRNIPPKWANLLLYLLTVWRPPRWVFDLLLERVKATTTEQPEYPTLALLLRSIYFTVRAGDHLRHMDFSTIQGPLGYVAWRSGLISTWKKIAPAYPRPAHTADSLDALDSAKMERASPRTRGRKLDLVPSGTKAS